MKRQSDYSNEASVFYNVKVILLDIEGTTTSIEFVKVSSLPNIFYTCVKTLML